MASHSEGLLWQEFNKLHLSRIYPNAIRVDSSNFNPYLGWGVGAQLIALNTQTAGIPLMLNQGFFRKNRGCGYVLKPNFMIDLKSSRKEPILLKINIISGQNFPKPNDMMKTLHPVVEVGIFGVNDIRRPVSHRCRTSTVPGNGFDPLWNQVFEFVVEVPELTQLSLRVLQDGHHNDESSLIALNRMSVSHGSGIGSEPSEKLIASTSIPIIDLRSGFRMVQLYDCFGKKNQHYAFSGLFVHIQTEIMIRNAKREYIY
jgi:hypothetical protein